MKIALDISKEAIECHIEYMEENTDQCYTPEVPYPPSREWNELLEALKDAYKKGER